MRWKQLASMLVVGVLVAVGLVAAVDAVRSDDPTERPERPRPVDEPDPPAARLEAEGIRGVLYYSDAEDDCRVHAVELPGLREVPPPKLRACRFELPFDPDPAWVPRGATWHPRDHLSAACTRGRVEVRERSGALVDDVEGCAPAWKPDGTLTVVRDGEIWDIQRPCEGECGRKLLPAVELSQVARSVRFAPRARRYLRSATAFEVAWLSNTRAAVLVRVALRRRLRVLGPVAVLALYEGRRLLRATQYAGAIALRVSPRRTFVGVVEAGGRVSIVGRNGRQRLGAADLPSPSTRAVAWSRDERWTAIATRWSVFLLPTADIEAGRQPRIVRLPLAARDLAWR
jgi:hypothetical protein